MIKTKDLGISKQHIHFIDNIFEGVVVNFWKGPKFTKLFINSYNIVCVFEFTMIS